MSRKLDNYNTLNKERKKRQRALQKLWETESVEVLPPKVIVYEEKNEIDLWKRNKSSAPVNNDDSFTFDFKNEFRELKEAICAHIDKKVTSRIRMLENEVKELKTLIVEQGTKVNEDILTFSEFESLYKDYGFPLKTVDDFNKLNMEISTNADDIATNIVKFMITSINTTIDASDNMTHILKRLLTRDVLLNYTAQRAKPGKSLFKDLRFYKSVEDAFIRAYNKPEINSKKVIQMVGLLLNNVKDWEGHRVMRMKPTTAAAVL